MKGQHYYDQLTPEQQEKYRRNVRNLSNIELGSILNMKIASMNNFIMGSFNPYHTPEGHKYWIEIASQTQFDPPSPSSFTPTPDPIYNSGIMLGIFIGFLTGTLLTMATREWAWQLIGLDIVIIAGIIYLYKKYRNEHSQAR